MGAPKAPHWTRKPPTEEGRYWAAVRNVGIFTGPDYRVLLCDAFGARLSGGLHVSGIMGGGAMPISWLRRQDIWWWSERIEHPAPPPSTRASRSR